MIEGFKTKYTIAIIGFILLTVGCAIIVYFNNCLESTVTVALGGIAIVTSVLAVGIADRKQKRLNVFIAIWKIRDTHTISDGNQKVSEYAFEIVNNGNESLSDFVVSFRFPDRNYHHPIQDKQNNRFFRFGESVVVQNDTLKYLGLNNEDNSVRFEHSLKNIDNWVKGNISITVSAFGYIPKTFVVRFQEKQLLLDSRNDLKIVRKN
jgi:hypothetical protein